MGRDEYNEDKSLEKAERFQRMFVVPVVEALKKEINAHLEPLSASMAEQEKRIQKLESNQSRAIKGFAVYSSAVAVIVGAVWAEVKKRIHWG